MPVPVTPTCPPLEPPVLINPHHGSHINTAHPTDIRVNVFGQARFDVTKIIPSTVHLGGASPIFSFTRHINKDPYLDATFVFRGTDVKLPPGIIDAHVTGQPDRRHFLRQRPAHLQPRLLLLLAGRHRRPAEAPGREGPGHGRPRPGMPRKSSFRTTTR